MDERRKLNVDACNLEQVRGVIAAAEENFVIVFDELTKLRTEHDALIARLEHIGARPYVTADLTKSAALDQHLKEAIAEFSPRKEQTMSRGLRRLKSLTETLMASIDAEADKAAVELQKNHDEAIDAVAQVKSHVGGEFKSAAADIKDLLNQVTNEPG